MTTYPFSLRSDLVQPLPPPAPDGFHYVDVRVSGRWDGILVVDDGGLCVGVYEGRRTQENPLPFDASQIEDVRSASLHNRLLASVPFDLWDAALLTIFVGSPIALVLAYLALFVTVFGSPIAVILALIVVPLLSLLSILGCAGAIHLMYLPPGFFFIRLLAALFGIFQIVAGAIVLWLWMLRLFTSTSA